MTTPATPHPPFAAMGLTAQATSATSVALAWKPGGGATAYELQRSARGSTWATIAKPTTTGYTDNGLVAGVTYTYQVRSTDAAGASVYGGSVSVTTPTGTVQPPVVTHTVTVTPAPVVGTTSPATPATTLVSAGTMLCGSPGTPATVWTVAARNGVCYDVTPLVNIETDDCIWSTPGATAVLDPTTGITGSPDGLVATTLVTVLYDVPGTYPVACTVTHADGSKTVYSATTTVTAEARTRRFFSPAGNAANKGETAADPLSYSALPALALAGGYRLTCAGNVPLVAGPVASIEVSPNTEIEGSPDAAGALPTFQIPSGSLAFRTRGGSDVVFRNLAFDAPIDASGVAPFDVNKLAAKGTTAIISNSHTLVFGCEIRHMYKGISGEGVGDLSVIGCRQTVKRGLFGQIASSFPTAGRFVLLLNDLGGGTVGEAVARVDCGVSVWGVARNLFQQDLSLWGGVPKPGWDARAGAGVATDNVFTDCDASISSSYAVAGIVVNLVSYVLLRWNTFVVSNANDAKYTNDISIKPSAQHITVRGNKPSGAFAKFVDGYAGLIAITIGTNAGK